MQADRLFDLPLEPRAEEWKEPPISDDQVEQLRAAFSNAGIHLMDERRQLIESCTLRAVVTIRELLAKDVRPILRCLEARLAGSTAASGSAWDTREEDTWIDRL